MRPSVPVQGRVRVGVVGTGWVATARHIPAFKRDRRAVLEAVLDPNLSKAEATAKRFGIPRSFNHLDAFLDERLDAVALCVPPREHASLIEAALGAGKHVLVEKPMTMTAEEGKALEAQAEASGLLLCPAHNFLFSRSVERAKSLQASGEIGRVESAMGIQLSSWRRRLPAWFDDLPGGLFFDEAPHLLYLMKHFLGELAVENAWRNVSDGTGTRHSERIEARLRADDAECYLTMWFGAPFSEWLVVLFCSRAVLVLDIFRDLLIHLPAERAHDSRDVIGQALRGTVQLWQGIGASGMRFARRRLSYGHELLVRKFLDSVKEGTAPPVTARDGWEVVALIEAILARASESS